MFSVNRVRALTKSYSSRGRLAQHPTTQFFQTSCRSQTCAVSLQSLKNVSSPYFTLPQHSGRNDITGIVNMGNEGSSLHKWARNFSTAIVDEDDNEKYDNVNARAEIKIQILNEALDAANESRNLYLKFKQQFTALNPESIQNIHNKWIEHEIQLSDAYSKAIKYTARLRRKDVAMKAQLLLDDMLSRHENIKEESNFLSYHDGPQFSDRTVMDLVNAIEQEYASKDSSSSPDLELTKDGIPLPTSKDFGNVLHSWASSKVKRKGLYAESLLYRMMELAFFYPENFSMPDSKTFGLVIKCHAGSTFKDSMQRIQRLHKIHDTFAAINVAGITKDDPFLLMHSIKSIRNFGAKEEADLVDEWFDRLHAIIIDPSNSNPDTTNENGDGDNGAIDLTGTYTSIIRGYAKLKRDANASEKAWLGIQRMQELSVLSKTLGTSTVATVDLKINAINLFFGSYGAQKDNRILAKKLALLNNLIESAMNQKNLSTSLDPLPNDQSFVGCIRALSVLNDPLQVTNEAGRIISAYESLVTENKVNVSPKVHNATIELYIDTFGKDKSSIGSLLSICTGMAERMERLKPSYPDIAPDNFTYMLFLKACSIDDGITDTSIERHEKATEIFKQLESWSGESRLNDKCYFYMMKCVSNAIVDPEEKQQSIRGLFTKACEGGFVSADVLKMLRINTTNEVFTQIVGNGRLPDKWVGNVTSGLALYTDGTTGGEGKNARRKGKSTSNWVRKQNERNQAIQSRNQAKKEKKRLKREREAKGKRRRS